MTEPDRWDGDESEDFHLGRYVQWLAAQAQAPVTEAQAERLAMLTDCHGGTLHCEHYQEGDGDCCRCGRANWCPDEGVTLAVLRGLADEPATAQPDAGPQRSPGTRLLDAVLHRGPDYDPTPDPPVQPTTEAKQDDTVHTCPGRWGGPDCRCFDDRSAPAEQPATEETQPESCAHCGKTIRRVNGTLTEWWVHIPGGQTMCSPWQPACSTRATPKPAAKARQDRCPSCDHKREYHAADDGKCWYTVDHGTPGSNLVCPCTPAVGARQDGARP